MSYSIIQKSQLEGAKRIDAEYYQPEYLELEKNLNKFKDSLKFFGQLLSNNNSLTGGATPLGANYPLTGIKFLRVQNIMPGYFDFSDVVFIDEKIHNTQLKRSRLVDKDVLLTITGVSYGKSAVYKSNYGEANINQHSVRMHFKDDLIPEYVSAFLNSKYGRYQSDRKITGNSRPALAYEEIRSYKIPVLPLEKQEIIKKIYEERMSKEDESVEIYRQSENLLLEELGLENFKFNNNLYYEVNFSETLVINRIDAEYFDPIYTEVEKILNKHEQRKLKDICSLISYGTVPTSPYVEKGIPYVKGENLESCFISDLDKLDFLSEDSTKNLPSKFYLKENDIVISQMGTVGYSAVATKENENWLFASFTIRARLNKEGLDLFDPFYMSLFINNISRPYYLLRKIAQASVRQNTDLPTINNLAVPLLSKEKQQKIAELVRKSHEARKKSKELLEEAKRKIEEIIEKGGEN